MQTRMRSLQEKLAQFGLLQGSSDIEVEDLGPIGTTQRTTQTAAQSQTTIKTPLSSKVASTPNKNWTKTSTPTGSPVRPNPPIASTRSPPHGTRVYVTHRQPSAFPSHRPLHPVAFQPQEPFHCNAFRGASGTSLGRINEADTRDVACAYLTSVANFQLGTLTQFAEIRDSIPERFRDFPSSFEVILLVSGA